MSDTRSQLNVRCSDEAKAKFEQAADASYMTLSGWVLQTLNREADRVLADQHGRWLSVLIDSQASPEDKHRASEEIRKLFPDA